MQMLFLRKGLSGHTMAAIFIHDLIPNVLSAVLPDTSGFSVIDANKENSLLSRLLSLLAGIAGAVRDERRSANGRCANRNL